jgi:tetratricopeptide (TPR) repeat protein
MLRDSLVFLALTSITLLLYAVTLFLFRSFESHRADLAVYWSDRGQDEMSHGHADQAATSLRNALMYDPDDRRYEMLLAEALAESGKTDQAMNYFLNLWDTQPGDGFINLELARLSRKKGLSQPAVNYYHASIFGDWRGDGTARRRDVRLELADYLASIHDTTAARAELLIAAGNASNKTDVNLVLGAKFAAIGDAADALNSYEKALESSPHEQAALETAGRLSLQLGDYASAQAFLDRVLKEGIKDPGQKDPVSTMDAEAKRLVELGFSPTLPDHVRAEHLMLGKAIAEARFNSCSAQSGNASQPQAGLLALKPRWNNAEPISLRTLENDATLQQSLSALISDTEILTSRACGAPSGDDAILLTLASRREPNH